MFSILLILLAALGFGLSLFLIILLLLNPKKYQNISGDPTVVIVKIVELHREHLPVNSANGWCLIPTNCNLRCWQKDLSFNVVGYPALVYACAKEIPCDAVILLNVIADVSTWSEWDVEAQDQIFHLELPENPSLHGDPYMQCDQVLTSSKLNTKPEIEMYRFGNLESNGTGWILLWNTNRLDWTLYVAQPIDDSTMTDGGQDRKEVCLLTAIWGCEPKAVQCSTPESLCRKVLNLAEAISWSQTKIRPFQSLMRPSSLTNPHFPTIHSALSDLPRRPCVLLEHEQKASFKNAALAVSPVFADRPLSGRSVARFSLSLKQLKKVSALSCDAEEKRRSRPRRQKLRSDSVNSGFPRNKQLDIETRRSSSLSTPARKTPPELTVTRAEDVDGPPQRSASHSFLHMLFPRRHSDSNQRSRSPSPSRRRKLFGFEKTSSVSSQEDQSSRRSSFQDLDVSDANEVDEGFLKMAHGCLDQNTDFKALGEYSISSVLQENLKASLVDVNASEEEQRRISGGWIFKEVHKNVAIFKKTTTLDACVVLSYLCKGILPTPLNLVWKTLCNPLTRFMYDDTVKKITVLKEYPEGQKLIHMCNESLTLLRKEVQDFCILQTEKVEGSQYMLGFHSVRDAVCPPVKNVLRGTVIASGWVLEDQLCDNSSCQVSYLVQMIVSTPEAGTTMEEISNQQSQCINNLSIYLSAKPPSYLAVQRT